MEENKKRTLLLEFFAGLCCSAAAAGGIYLISLYRHRAQDVTVSNMVLAVLGVTALSYFWRVQYLEDRLDHNNGLHPFRFWMCFLAGLAVAFGCVFLPVSGWPFPAIFVLLALFSNGAAGLMGGTVLLMIPMLLAGAQTGVFFLYFISGVFAATLFRKMENGLKIGVPMFLSLFCLLLCEMAQVILLENARPSLEAFSVPFVNIVINGSLFAATVKLFSSSVVYPNRERYLELNDTENELMKSFKERAKEDYLQGVHTAHFCDRIAKQLGLSEEALQCAAYYHKWGDTLPKLMKEKRFPPLAKKILQEYGNKNTALHRETVILICADTIVSSMQYMLQGSPDKPLEYDKIIDTVFKRFSDRGDFKESDLTLRELEQIKAIFKEEKLYYDFLR